MLKRLTVSNLAVVEKAEALFVPGLNVLTGETGAGKSVLMGALDLVLGGKAEASVVRKGAAEAEVEADFDGVVVRRTVTPQGRSRAWINDESVSIAELRDFAHGKVDLHGPTAAQRLLVETFQRETLDAYGAVKIATYAKHWNELVALRAERDRLLRGGGEDELDLLRYQVQEIAAADLTEEDETVAERHAAAAHAGEILENANEITETLGGDRSAAELLIGLQPKCRAIARHLPQAEGWAAQLEELVVRIQELSRTVADAASGIDCGEEDLDALDARLTVVNRLKRKYGATVADVLAKLAEKKSRLDELENRETLLAEVDRKLSAAEKAVRAEGAVLTKARQMAGERLAKVVTAELRGLGFLQSKFSVAIEEVEPAAYGLDRVVFVFEPNPGEPARPLAAIASSGEIARVMLALKSVLAVHDATETLVFDEIDANIGGEVGRAVGERLRKVAKGRQVIAITHLPQSAAFGERHLVVRKQVSGGRTRTIILQVEGDDRISEIARMLGGEKLTTVVRKHAEELLGLSR